MATADAADEPEFEPALDEALASLRDAYPEATDTDGGGLDALTALLAPSLDETVRRDAARILAMLAEQFPEELVAAVPALVDALDDAAAREHVLRALGYVSDADPEAVSAAADSVVPLLDADDAAVVRDAAWVVSNVASTDSDAVAAAFPVFVRLLSHDDEAVRRRAAGALAVAPESVLTADGDTLETLLEMLASPSLYRTVGRTLVAVAPVYGDRLVEGLFAYIDGGRPTRREHAAWTLVRLADDHPDLVRPRWSALVDVLRDDDDHQVQNSAAAALAAVGAADSAPELVAAVRDLLDHEDRFVRRYACLALGDVAVATGDGTALRALADARADDAPLVSQLATEKLATAAQTHPDAVAAVAPNLVEELREQGELNDPGATGSDGDAS